MSEDFYPFVDSGDPAPDNSHLAGEGGPAPEQGDSGKGPGVNYATRISVYDDMLSTPRVIVIDRNDVRTYLEEITNTVYRLMKEQGGSLSLMVIRELVENFIHAHFIEPVISILDGGDTIRFADQGPGISDKDMAFEFGVTSADRSQKRYIRGTGAGLPMVQQYLENAGGAISIEDNLNQGTVVTVSVDPDRVAQIEGSVSRGAAVRGAAPAAGAGMQGIPADPPRTTMAGASRAPMTAPVMPSTAQGYPTPYPYPYQGMVAQTVARQVTVDPMTGQPVPSPGAYMQLPSMGTPLPYQPQPQWPAAIQAGTMPGTGIDISERGMRALGFMAEHGAAGPTDLFNAYGESAPTWSRELAALARAGLVRKHGQKRVLTDMGKAWLEQR